MDYHLSLTFGSEGDFYLITKGEFDGEEVVWRREWREDEDLGDHSWPADVRAKYEELNGVREFDPEWTGEKFIAGEVGYRPQLVEIVALEDEDAWDQPCVYGHRCGGHAVYCHNDGWLYSPRKCRRTWYTGGDTRDEDCRGYFPNPNRAPAP